MSVVLTGHLYILEKPLFKRLAHFQTRLFLLLGYRSSLFLISTSTIMNGLTHINAYHVSSSIQSFLTVLTNLILIGTACGKVLFSFYRNESQRF